MSRPGYAAVDPTGDAAVHVPALDGVPVWRHAKDKQTRHGFVALLAVSAGPGTAATLDAPHTFLLVQGLLYAAVGAVAMLTPRRVGSALRMDPPLDDDELAVLPLAGLALFVVAYLYVQGARSNAAPAHFVAWSSVYRVLVVPLGMVGLHLLGGARGELCLCLGVAEGVLGALTCVHFSCCLLAFCPSVDQACAAEREV